LCPGITVGEWRLPTDRMKAIHIIKALGVAQNAADQADVIRTAWDKDCEEFFIGLDLATNPDIKFGLSAVPEIAEDDDGDPGTLTFAHFHKVALNISNGQLEPAQVRKVLEECALTANISEWNLWYRRILLKTLTTHLPMAVIQNVLIQLTKENSVLPGNSI
jgi:hypothetical protein